MSSQPEILAVVLNCHRPANIPLVIEALRAQTVKCHIALVDCEDAYREWPNADSLFYVGGHPDPGPIARTIAPLMLPQFPLTFFAVDDYLPGIRCVEWMREAMGDNSGCIGQDGRCIRDGQIVRRKAKLLPSAMTRCDFITSSELVTTELIPAAAAYMQYLWKETDGENGGGVSMFEDDLLLGLGITQASGDPCYLTPAPPTPEHSWRMKRLPSHNALSARPDHDERRAEFVREAIRLGWKSCC